MRHLCLPTIAIDTTAPIAVDAATRHRLRRVLRLEAGVLLQVTDGRGSRRCCEWTGATLVGVEAPTWQPRPRPRVEIAAGLIKGPRWETLIEKCVEVGVDRIVPLALSRSVVRLASERAADKQERWQDLAIAALEQCGRCWLPEIAPLADLATWLAETTCPRRYFGDEAGAGPALQSLLRDQNATDIAIAVGPEGGFSEAERSTLVAGDVRPVQLADAILRAETAAIVAATLAIAATRPTGLRGG